jgi:ferredoxin-NADP reductase
VTEVVRESTMVSSVYLSAADGNRLPAAQAGLYLTLRIPGAGTPAPVRSYSLSSAPDVRTYRISVKQELNGAASRYLRRSLRPGAVLEAAAPRGDFVLDAADGPVLLISAGIGVTPLLSMLHELAAAAASGRSGGCTGHAARSTVHRATSVPSRFSCRHTFRAP